MLGLNKKSNRPEMEITISNRMVIRVLVLVIMSFIFLAALRQAAHALFLIFIAFFLALSLNSPVHWLADRLPGKRRGSRGMATGISFLVIIVLLGSFLASIVPPLVRQTSNFIDIAPDLVEDVRDENSALGRFVRENNLEEQVDKLSSEVSARLGNISSSAVSAASRISSSAFAVLAVLALTFMMLAEGPRWAMIFKRLIPVDQREHVERVANDMYRVIKGYVNGQVILAAMAAGLILVPLVILDISYPVALMVIVFICGLIPMVGHTIGALIVSTVALFSSPWSALIIFGYYILYQQIENYTLQPIIQSNSTNMSPLLVFSSVLIGVSFSGLLGGLVAIPLAGCLRILVLDYLNARHLIHDVPESAPTPKEA